MEGLGHGHRLLADHGVDHQQRLPRADRRVDVADLGHQLVVDLEPAGGVEDDHVTPGLLGLGHGIAGDPGHGRTGRRAVDGDVEAWTPSVLSWSMAAGR